MHGPRKRRRAVARLWMLVLLTGLPHVLLAQTSPLSQPSTNPPIVLTVEGTNVWIQRVGSPQWESARPDQVLSPGDRGRTGPRSRATIRLSDLSVMRVGPQSAFEIQAPTAPKEESGFSLFRGLFYLLHRAPPSQQRFITPTASAATRGTEFVLEVDPTTGTTTLTVLEGEAELTTTSGSILLADGDAAVAEPGQGPRKTAVLDRVGVIQWCLYYPGVLDLDELELDTETAGALTTSLTAFRAGDLLAAIDSYPPNRVPASDHERLYLAALLLAVGQVVESETLLDQLHSSNASPRAGRLAQALLEVIAAVQFRARTSNLPSGSETRLATEWLAESYRLQSLADLTGTRDAARHAVNQSPEFAFAWVRLAELEFSHGNTQASLAALERGLRLAPRNAQALALRGFLSAAENRDVDALTSFEQALRVDGGLGNAWLGRGLCRIRLGQAEAGRIDLQVAATLEPHRSLLRSYLGKAWSHTGQDSRAQTELKIARDLDRGDPTPWLYSALLLQRSNRPNEAARRLQRSRELNDNRAVYRSRLLLDEDRAVRGANLASIYRDAGLGDLGLREAARAVNTDYANYSTHLFLADAYNEFRDPDLINLRYETAWFNEHLLANLLSPVGSGSLAPRISQQEYSKLFDQDGFGLTSSTEYRSHGEWIQSASHYGRFPFSSYAAEVFYRTDPGDRPNTDLQQWTTRLSWKEQVTPQDLLYLRASYFETETGDVRPYYDPDQANPGLRVREHGEPSFLVGYHREWHPGSHSLLLAGRLANSLDVTNSSQTTLLLNRGIVGNQLTEVGPLFYRQQYHAKFELYTAEGQHIWRGGSHTLIFGAKGQLGELETANHQTNGRFITGVVPPIPVGHSPDQRATTDFTRGSVYLHHHWAPWPSVLLVGGVSYDWLRFPENYRFAPISIGRDTRDQVSPKLGLILTPAHHTTIRAAYFRNLGGVSLDQSVRLEPSQIAGFNQAFRSLIPEAMAGGSSAATFETWALSLEQQFGARTFLALSAERNQSDVDRVFGVVERAGSIGSAGSPYTSQSTAQELEFVEHSLAFTFHRLLTDEWSAGLRYRLSYVELDTRFPEIPSTVPVLGDVRLEENLTGLIHQSDLFAVYNHPAGFFGSAHALWTSQHNHGYEGARPGDAFWQFNLEAGWRFRPRRAELRLGLLNLTDQDYRLNPLNLTTPPPRRRTLAVRFQFSF